jgi:fatty-acyl-CoA synthase
VIDYGEAGVRRCTWAEFDGLVNRAAHAIAARCRVGNMRVALMLPNCLEYVVAQQALARLGATAVQIGHRSKPNEIAHILANAAPSVTIVHTTCAAAMREAHDRVEFRGATLVVGAPGSVRWARSADDWDQALSVGSPDTPPDARRSDGGGLIVYTSGTTGVPKGATRAWRETGLASIADLMYRVGMRADDRHLVVCPLYHSAAPAFVAMLMSLGATIVVQNHFNPERCLDIIAAERITCSVMVPTMLSRLSALPETNRGLDRASSLRWVMSAAAPLPIEVARRFMDAFGPVLWNCYGSTETGLVTLAQPSDHTARPGTIGRCLRGNDIRLLDDEGNPVACGEVGELFVRNSMLMTGYYGDPQATREATSAGWLSVGDVCRLDSDGYLYLESRKRDMVISGGVNIYPREIEDRLHTHPAILEAAVVGVPDPEWGETLRAFVVLRSEQQLTESEVIDYCRAELSDFKRPRQVTFVTSLPRNAMGKVLKHQLRAEASLLA